MSQVTCPSCSTQAPPGAVFCDNCGYDLRNVQPAAQPPPVQPPPQQAWPQQTAPQVPAPPPQQAFPPQPAGGLTCPSCGHPNIAGALFCENCGSALSAVPPTPAPVPVSGAQPPYPTSPALVPTPPQTPVYTPPVPGYITGRFVVQGSNVNLAIPQGVQIAVIGREDPVSGIFPEINLDPHGGQDAGVGRQHAKLTSSGGQVFIEDNNSVNGTWVNKQKLVPGQAMPLSEGAEVRLGKLVLNYYSS